MQAATLALSLAMHAALIVLLSMTFSFSNRPDLLDIPQVVAVDLVAIGEETVVKPTPPKEPVEEAPPVAAAPKPKAEEKAPEPEETVTLPEDPKPPLTAAKEKKPEPKPVKKAEALKAKPKKEEPVVDESAALDDFAKLIDRSKETQTKSEQAEEDFFAAFSKDKNRSKVADSRAQSISLIDAARNQVQRCWAPPLGARDAAQMRVRVSVLLGPDGAVIGTPTLDPADRRRMQRSSETVFRVFTESAVRAIQQCAPFKLPKERYNEWRSLRLNFDPSQMLN